ncbi:TIM barrel protein [Sulfurimonas aquatica]|uniref:TIM barrel protein n=1 Tax=Sulfurimonas aquatica TaxID=2672570 RepID=A0A975GBK8_9BACT|nr:TIM barrel protein [Sulfurimonas aquatica]QSZ40655.1 TIM barrel protein [Sulfurimonas aquatica]
MKLENFKTMWGFEGDFETACIQAKEAGFEGIEGPSPQDQKERDYWKTCLEKYELEFIAEITTGGDYVPKRDHSVIEHISDVEIAIKNSLELNPRFMNCMGGCDAWEEEDSIIFFKSAIAIAKSYDIEISFETHRSRSLFTPWVTRRMTKAIPEMKLTLDISHWCVVAERLMDTEMDTIKAIAPNVHHFHARVGYAQGPQVPHPAAPEYQKALQSHQECWELAWDSQKAKGMKISTMTPEFGPDGYLHTLPFTNAPIADLWEINCWMAETQKKHFNDYTKY